MGGVAGGASCAARARRLSEADKIIIFDRGGIRVDAHMRTSDEKIWAVGDAVEVKDVMTGQMGVIPLAGPPTDRDGLPPTSSWGGM